jgi:hypothetical protein
MDDRQCHQAAKFERAQDRKSIALAQNALKPIHARSWTLTANTSNLPFKASETRESKAMLKRCRKK